MVEGKPLPTIWDVPDDLWERIEPVMLELDPPKSKGRNRVDQRKMLEGIIFRLRSGCQWNHLPKELGDDSTIHRTFQRWVGCGALEGIWAVLIEECQELGGVNWEWQSADCSMGKARLGGGAIGRNPTEVPNEVLRPIHDRMPVMLPREMESFWLDPNVKDPGTLSSILAPYPGGEMQVYEVASLVNRPSDAGPEIVVPFED